MLEDLPDVPPAVFLLVRELVSGDELIRKTWADKRQRIKSMLSELRDQSEVYWGENLSQKIAAPKPLEFDIHLHGGLDLFGTSGCSDFSCRMVAADRVSSSMGLIADHIWITDHFTERFINFGRATNAKLDMVIEDTIILMRIFPLISAGILRFRSPIQATCVSCSDYFDTQVHAIAKQLAPEFQKQIKITPKPDGGFFAETGTCFSPPLWLHWPSSNKAHDCSPISMIEGVIRTQIRTALFIARQTAESGGAIFSNSRIGLAGLLQQEGRFNGRKQLMMLDKQRTLNVPWVSELNPSQILQLRQEASSALPIFRERMARALSVTIELGEGITNVDSLMQELREQAAQVRAELAIKQKHSAKFWKTTYGLLGFALSAYGVATDQVLPGAAGLLPLIKLLIDHNSGDEQEIANLTSRPSYVLVKAQDILQHAH